jgi:glycosyltransferase involved in cell wall biosynthesis
MVVFEPTNCAAVIPCFNESASIASLVPVVRRYLPCVFVVDDGSTDGTASLARAAGAVVARHERNLGKGVALGTGLARALEQGFEWAVTLDGDGQHAPEDLPALFACAQRTNAVLVIGDRMNEARKMPWLRRQVNRWMSRQLSRRAGRPLPDTQSGFRLIHLPTWACLSLKAQRFEVESETLMAFLAAGLRVEFAPVRVNRSRRKSHICPVADSLRWLNWWRKSDRPTESRHAAFVRAEVCGNLSAPRARQSGGKHAALQTLREVRGRS